MIRQHRSQNDAWTRGPGGNTAGHAAAPDGTALADVVLHPASGTRPRIRAAESGFLSVRLLGLLLLGALSLGVLWWVRRDPGAVEAMPEQAHLAQLAKNKDIPALAAALHDQNPLIATRAAEWLAAVGGEEARRHLAAAINDSRPPVREAAVAQFAVTTDRHQVEPLNAALTTDPSPAVRSAAAKALGQLRAWNGIEALLVGLNDAAPIVRECSFNAIQRITGVRFQFKADDGPDKLAALTRDIRASLETLKSGYDFHLKQLEHQGKVGATP